MSEASGGERASTSTSTVGRDRRGSPAPALLGFILLLVAMFGVSYAVGHAVGPVAPGMHGSSSGGGGGGHDSGPGSGDMGGMEMDHGSGG
ncbi:hypothetical protein [Streptomyces sp. NPDC051684]|uniref:hypothetical protein n=1 Tax=Streptomyces sp. NPDC051684 TaxID=3365670 RepID=UPI00379F8659